MYEADVPDRPRMEKQSAEYGIFPVRRSHLFAKNRTFRDIFSITYAVASRSGSGTCSDAHSSHSRFPEMPCSPRRTILEKESYRERGGGGEPLDLAEAAAADEKEIGVQFFDRLTDHFFWIAFQNHRLELHL